MKTIAIRRHLRGAVLGGLFVLAICVGIVLFASRRGAKAAVISGVVVVLCVAAGIATVVPKTVVAIELGPGGLTLRFAFGKEQRVPLAALTSARVMYTPLGSAGPDGGRTRMVRLELDGANPLIVTDAEYTDVSGWIAALQALLEDRLTDERDEAASQS